MPHKDPEAARAYYEANRERRRITKQAWYVANREKEIARATQWVKDNRDQNNATRRAYLAKNPEKIYKAVAAWRAANPEKTAYMKHRQDAKMRGVPWLITFEEWWSVWDASGKWPERGHCSGQYVMARYGDRGPYAVGNVRIITCNENVAEMHAVNPQRGKPKGPYRKRAHG